jgi:hypothetical protein
MFALIAFIRCPLQAQTVTAKRRGDYADGSNMMLRHKGTKGIDVYATEWTGHKAPPAHEPARASRGIGNNNLLVWWSNTDISARDLANAFMGSRQTGEGGVSDLGFDEIQFVDANAYCYALVFPRPFGIGELKCEDRITRGSQSSAPQAEKRVTKTPAVRVTTSIIRGKVSNVFPDRTTCTGQTCWYVVGLEVPNTRGWSLNWYGAQPPEKGQCLEATIRRTTENWDSSTDPNRETYKHLPELLASKNLPLASCSY